jgi:hypothetical protein
VVGLQLFVSLINPITTLGLPEQSPTTAASATLSFGPSRESVLTDAIDLETGSMTPLPLPHPLSENAPERYSWFNGRNATPPRENPFPWLRQHGIDFIDLGNHGLAGIDLWLIDLEPHDWDTMNAADLDKKLRTSFRGFETAAQYANFDNARGTYGFKTRDGTLGLIQCLDPDLPLGVKIRYKLVPSLPLVRPEVPATPQERLDQAIKKLAAVSGEEERFHALNDAAKQSFSIGRLEDARKYAGELLTLAQRFPRDWNYGNAIQDANLVLGRIALKEGKLDEARECLLAAGRSPGSPQMDSFGPNMSLARDLLEKGERETVLQYFALCRKFWKLGQNQLDRWTNDAKGGIMPEFGANLVY